MIDKIIDMLIDEKIGCKEYEEISENVEDEDIKEMFKKISEDEHNHYKMIKEYLNRLMNENVV